MREISKQILNHAASFSNANIAFKKKNELFELFSLRYLVEMYK